MLNITLRDLLDAGVHFGHRTRLWDPKMKPYIFKEQNGVHIIDLYKTARCLVEAINFVQSQVSKGKTVLFVGTTSGPSNICGLERLRTRRFHHPFCFLLNAPSTGGI